MNRTVNEWIAKAEGDFASAGRELRARKCPNYDSACFHAQQCIEKLMKAFLVSRGVVFPKTHDLLTIQKLAAPGEEVPAAMAAALRSLTRAAIALRYPGETADRHDAAEAYRICGRLRKLWRQRLGLRENA